MDDLSIIYVPLRKGKYTIFNVVGNNENLTTDGLYKVGYYDEFDAYYLVDEYYEDNYIEVTNYDSVAQTIQGKYNVHFEIAHKNGFPEYVHFSDGVFDIKIHH